MTTTQVILSLGVILAAQLGTAMVLVWHTRRDNDRVVDSICQKNAAEVESAIREHADECEARMRQRSERFKRP